jgi:hypothetical protein
MTVDIRIRRYIRKSLKSRPVHPHSPLMDFLRIHPIYIESRTLLKLLCRYYKKGVFQDPTIFQWTVEFAQPPLNLEYITRLEKTIKDIHLCLPGGWKLALHNRNSKEKSFKRFSSLTKSTHGFKRDFEKSSVIDMMPIDRDPKKVAWALATLDRDYIGRLHILDLYAISKPERSGQNRSGNICALFEHSERVFRWTLTEILRPSQELERVKTLNNFIRLCGILKRLRDYHGLWMVLGALHSYSISRLEREWNQLPPKRRKKFKSLSRFIDPQRGYRLYRRALQKSPQLAIPCFPILMQDLIHSHALHRPYKSLPGQHSTTVNEEFVTTWAAFHTAMEHLRSPSLYFTDLPAHSYSLPPLETLLTEEEAIKLSRDIMTPK